ncbi:hypothetical protein [Flavihumibacter profundi]|uniref:hypothetical protein n=1 Tax=Flavihumibacter profundi TaxID=2716883 RepID=UPI001CC3B385|nr:hypothetical protein [Flavihumibacter profundi]MBZ5855504.1 hypothetical protein [Flavihumibacter profundi]
MVTAAWFLGLNVIRKNDLEKKHLAFGAFFLVIPWILVSIFFGFGPPPGNAKEWVATATEQQVRYSILVIAGVFIAFGFAVVRERLKNKGEFFYSLLGFLSIIIAIPLFIINMLFWGFFLTETFRILVASTSDKTPEWFMPVRSFFGLISIVEVSLTYLAIAALAASLKLTGWFGKIPSLIYIIMSLSAFIIIVLSAFGREPFAQAGFALSIPAIPFVMPYFIGINLLRRAGN